MRGGCSNIFQEEIGFVSFSREVVFVFQMKT
jgi:hypothetical protein